MKNIIIFVMDSVSFEQISNSYVPFLSNSTIMKAYSSATYTLPSMKAMLHGMIPSNRENGIYDWDPAEFWIKSMPEVLKTKGYQTICISSNPLLSSSSMNIEFDREYFLPVNGMELLRYFKSIKLKQPFYAIFLFKDTHHPYLNKLWTENPMVDMEKKKEVQRNAIDYLDTVLAQLYDFVPKDTDIYVTSDHGEMFKEDRFGHDPRPVDKLKTPGGGCLGYKELLEVFIAKVSK